jgi:hypothetical protein
VWHDIQAWLGALPWFKAFAGYVLGFVGSVWGVLQIVGWRKGVALARAAGRILLEIEESKRVTTGDGFGPVVSDPVPGAGVTLEDHYRQRCLDLAEQVRELALKNRELEVVNDGLRKAIKDRAQTNDELGGDASNKTYALIASEKRNVALAEGLESLRRDMASGEHEPVELKRRADALATRYVRPRTISSKELERVTGRPPQIRVPVDDVATVDGDISNLPTPQPGRRRTT